MLQSEVEAERDRLKPCSFDLEKRYEPERTKRRAIASELCEMDKKSERVFLIRDALRNVSWDPMQAGMQTGRHFPQKAIFSKDITSFDAKLESGIFAVSAAINARETSTGNPSKEELNEDKEWLRLSRLKERKLLESIQDVIAESGKGKKMVASAIESAIEKAVKVGRNKFVAKIEIEEKENMDVDEKKAEDGSDEEENITKRNLPAGSRGRLPIMQVVWTCMKEAKVRFSYATDVHANSTRVVLIHPWMKTKSFRMWFCPICVAKKKAFETSKLDCEMITPTSLTRTTEGTQLECGNEGYDVHGRDVKVEIVIERVQDCLVAELVSPTISIRMVGCRSLSMTKLTC